MLSLVLSLALSAPGAFPLPLIDGKPLATTAEQRKFRLPMRFERIRSFYENHFVGDEVKGVVIKAGIAGEKRTLTLISTRSGDSWKKAVIREGAVDTEIEVTPIVRIDETAIEGNAKPLVQFIIGRSADVDRAVKSIDTKHLEQVRH